jgi:sigma-E factor negative regulatory protein RseA
MTQLQAPLDVMMTATNPLSAHELLSLVMDGQASAAQTAALVQACQDDASLMHTWASYHAIGDALRSPPWQAALPDHPIAQPKAPGTAQARASLADKPAANDALFRWKLVAGIAAFGAMASVLWSVVGSQTNSSQLAAQQATQPATVLASDVNGSVMIRNPRLDELLAAHKQFGGASALQQPAGFLRNATFQPADR